MKILFPMFSMGRSGGERVLSKLCNSLSCNGFSVFIVVPDYVGEPYYPYSEKIIILKSKTLARKIKLLSFFYNFYQLVKTCRQVKADFAIANYNLTSYIVILLQKKVKKFYYIQAYEYHLTNIFALKILAFLSYLLPLKKVVNSTNILPSFLNNFVGVLPPGIDLELFTESDKDKNTFNIGFVGRKESYKGSLEIVKALSKINHIPNIQINVAVHYCSTWSNFVPNIRFYKINSDSDLSNFYKTNHLIIATGLIEDGAFHYPCAEAIASKCLVISNYSPLTESNSPLSLSSFDETELINKLMLVLSYSDEQIREEIENNYKLIQNNSWSKISSDFINLIENAK